MGVMGTDKAGDGQAYRMRRHAGGDGNINFFETAWHLLLFFGSCLFFFCVYLWCGKCIYELN